MTVLIVRLVLTERFPNGKSKLELGTSQYFKFYTQITIFVGYNRKKHTPNKAQKIIFKKNDIRSSEECIDMHLNKCQFSKGSIFREL